MLIDPGPWSNALERESYYNLLHLNSPDGLEKSLDEIRFLVLHKPGYAITRPIYGRLSDIHLLHSILIFPFFKVPI